ncbi:thioredoxin-like protein, partial [Phellopilus nigrolimitatus]
QTFLKAISKDSSQGKVVLVDFYANWCGPCKMLSPILEKLTATENADAIKTGSGLALDLVTVDTDANGELAMKYQARSHFVSSLPTVVAFKNGEPVLKFTGALPEPRVKDFIAQL